MKKLRIGVVGTGGMARTHVRYFREVKGVEVATCFDIDRPRADAFAEAQDIPAVAGSLDELIDASDAVTVVTSDRAHAPVSLAVLKAGKHLMCEKPLTVTLAEARQVARAYEAARKKGVVGMVNFSHRGSHFYKAKEMVARGRLGELRYIRSHYLQGWLPLRKRWQRPASLWRLQTGQGSGGVLGDLGCHLLDFATGVCGEVARLRCTMRVHPKIGPGGKVFTEFGGFALDANDTVAVDLDFAEGAYGNAQTTRWAAGARNEVLLEVHGTDGALSLGHTFPEKPFIRVCRGQKAMSEHAWTDVKVRPMVHNWARFVRSIRRGEPAEPDITRGSEVQSMLDACFRSVESGRSERLLKWV